MTDITLTGSRVRAIFLILSANVGMTIGCSTGHPTYPSPTATRRVSPGNENAGNRKQSSVEEPIRRIDFANFTYPWLPDLGDPKRTFTLRDGKLAESRDANGMVGEMGVTLESVAYGDVTGDGPEKAMVILSLVTGGSAIPHAIYIYASQDGKPKLLWALSTGDRAEGGLRRVYAENGGLVIERYSPIDSKGDCCPTLFTRARFVWQGNNFQRKGREEVLPNSEGRGSLVMTPHKPS